MDISKPFGRWRIADDNPHIGERSSFYRVVRTDDPTVVGVLKICTSSDDDVVRAFRREIDNTKSQPLPGMMPVVYEDDRDGRQPWFVMSFSKDIDMSRKDADLAGRVALFLIECAIALRELGLLYCDFKPENVGIEKGPDGEEHFVLRDWETLREMSAANIRPGVAGTRYYRSQEDRPRTGLVPPSRVAQGCRVEDEHRHAVDGGGSSRCPACRRPLGLGHRLRGLAAQPVGVPQGERSKGGDEDDGQARHSLLSRRQSARSIQSPQVGENVAVLREGRLQGRMRTSKPYSLIARGGSY